MEQEKEAAAKTAEKAAESVKEKLGHAKDYVGERYQAVSDKVKSRYESVSQAAKDKAAEVKHKVEQIEVDDVVDQMRDYVRSNPGKALLISIGIGFVIGLVMRGGDDEDES